MALPLLLIAALVVVVVGGGGAAYLLFFRGPALGGDWPRIRGLPVKEHSPNKWPTPPPPKRLKEITPAEYRTLCALCDTFVPSFTDEAALRSACRAYVEELLRGSGSEEQKAAMVAELTRDMGYYEQGALATGVPLKVADVIEEQVPADGRFLLRMVLRAFEMPLGLLFLTGKWHGWQTADGAAVGFSSLDFEKRESILRSLLTSPIAPTRGLTLLIKGMTGRVYFGSRGEEEGKDNPTWKALNYEDRTEAHVQQVLHGSNKGKGSHGTKTNGGKSKEPPALGLKPPKLSPLTKGDMPPSSVGGEADVRELFCDVVIVGSGAGGGTAAGVLCQAGLDVVVLEKGAYHTEADFAKWGELDGEKGLYERSGYMASEEISISLLAGSCVGGGTTLNWCASFRTPQHVRRDWATTRGLKQFATPEYDAALDAVCRRLNVNIEHSHANDECPSAPGLAVNDNNQALWEGAKAVGMQCLPLPRNVKGCKDCSACERGCPYGAKQSTLATFLEDAQATKKLRLVARAHVDKVLRAETGQAIGVIASVQNDDDGSSYRLIVWSEKAVIAACGSLHTPALLLRSGLKHPKIGRHLALHPVTAVGGLFPGRFFETHKGVGMGTYVPATMAGKDGDGWGGAIETPPLHPGIAGVCAPWSSAFNYRAWTVLRGQFAVNVVISRDHSGPHNRVVVDKQGWPRVHYSLTPRDRQNMLHSVGVMAQMMLKMGASLVMPVYDGFRSWRKGRDGEGGLEAYVKYLEAMGLPAGSAQLFTAHQMCSCRMADSPSQGPVDAEGAVWETPGLYVMDASVFPTSLGINPMITVEAISYMNARRLAGKIAGTGALERVDARYGTPTAEEAQGKCSFPEGPTLKGEYGVCCDW